MGYFGGGTSVPFFEMWGRDFSRAGVLVYWLLVDGDWWMVDGRHFGVGTLVPR